jgi:integrase/recombinase XerD
MSESNNSLSPLRQRMIEDMTMRKLTPKTKTTYLRHVSELGEYLGFSPHRASSEDLRLYQLHLVKKGQSSGSINARLTGLRFSFEVTIDDVSVLKQTKHVKEPRRIPQILSVEEVTRLLDAAENLKYQAALSIAYGAGLRRNEVVHLKISDIDSDRMIIRVEQGKGAKDRHAMLSPTLLELLRSWYRYGIAQNRILPKGWLFPGQNPVNPLSARQLNRGFHQALDAANIDKKVTLHSLRLYLQHTCLSLMSISASYKCC